MLAVFPHTVLNVCYIFLLEIGVNSFKSMRLKLTKTEPNPTEHGCRFFEFLVGASQIVTLKCQPYFLSLSLIFKITKLHRIALPCQLRVHP